MLRVLKSIKTGLYIIAIAIPVFLAGSIHIPGNLPFFSDINDMPLFRWLALNSSYPEKTYWIYLSIFLMAFLALNMIVCTIDDVIRRFSIKYLIQRLSPHIIHLGILTILLGHLISATAGFKKDVSLIAGEEFFLEDMVLKVEDVRFVSIKGEDQSRWRVNLKIKDDNIVRRFIIEPARPAFYRYGFYAKSAEKSGKVIIGIVDDLGAKWEVIGAIFFILGSSGLLWTRYRNEFLWSNR